MTKEQINREISNKRLMKRVTAIDTRLLEIKSKEQDKPELRRTLQVERNHLEEEKRMIIRKMQKPIIQYI